MGRWRPCQFLRPLIRPLGQAFSYMSPPAHAPNAFTLEALLRPCRQTATDESPPQSLRSQLPSVNAQCFLADPPTLAWHQPCQISRSSQLKSTLYSTDDDHNHHSRTLKKGTIHHGKAFCESISFDASCHILDRHVCACTGKRSSRPGDSGSFDSSHRNYARLG
jgi:hypothetical protein